MVYVWKSYTYIEEVGHQFFFSQTTSSSTCERNWNTFALIHKKQRNRLTYPQLQQFVFCCYNMKLKLRNIETENDQVVEKDYIDLLDISAKMGDEEDNCSNGLGFYT